jgi:CRISPR-associated protein Cas2
VKDQAAQLVYRRTSRTLWLIAYDIRHPKRWRYVYRRLCGVGVRLQYSVFILSSGDDEIDQLVADISAVIDDAEDDVRFYHLPAGTEVWYGQPPPAEGILLSVDGMEEFW